MVRSFSLCVVRVPHPAQYDILDNHHGNRKKKTKKKTVPWLYSSRSDWHALHRRGQPTPTPIYIKSFTASVPTEAKYFTYILPGVGWAARYAGGRCTHAVYARSLRIIDPGIPTLPGRSRPGFRQSGRQACAKGEVP